MYLYYIVVSTCLIGYTVIVYGDEACQCLEKGLYYDGLIPGCTECVDCEKSAPALYVDSCKRCCSNTAITTTTISTRSEFFSWPSTSSYGRVTKPTDRDTSLDERLMIVVIVLIVFLIVSPILTVTIFCMSIRRQRNIAQFPDGNQRNDMEMAAIQVVALPQDTRDDDVVNIRQSLADNNEATDSVENQNVRRRPYNLSLNPRNESTTSCETLNSQSPISPTEDNPFLPQGIQNENDDAANTVQPLPNNNEATPTERTDSHSSLALPRSSEDLHETDQNDGNLTTARLMQSFSQDLLDELGTNIT